MALSLQKVRAEISDVEIKLDLAIPDGVVLGVTGIHAGELQLLADVISGAVPLTEGRIERDAVFMAQGSFRSAETPVVEWWVEAAFDSPAQTLVLGPALALTDPLFHAWTARQIEQRRRSGTVIVIVSRDLDYLARVADEVVVLDEGSVVLRGDPGQTLAAYRERIAAEMRLSSELLEPDASNSHGDGRAVLVDLDWVGADGASSATVRSGEAVTACLRVRFDEDVTDPVFGILIRNRVGVAVYGTNTELEGLSFGPCRAGEEYDAMFSFDCDLCPGEYTLTAASHDRDGTAHDWAEEALLFTVVDARYTAGVANLRAEVQVEKVD